MKQTIELFQAELHNLPQNWQLTLLGGRDASGKIDPKVPYTNGWANLDIDRELIITEIEAGKATGYGLRLGKPSGYLVAIDFDGKSAIELGLEKFGTLADTVTWSSSRPGRHQALFSVPEQYRDLVKNKTVKTGVIDEDGKAEQLEFRYTGNQSVLPPSPHPITDGYHWINNPIDTPVAELPQAVIDYWLSLLAPKVTSKSKVKTKPEPKLHSEAYTSRSIPLKDCLAKSNRELLRGVTEGGRNHAGATLARDINGAANYLESIGVAYDGDPRGLFDDFCQNCDPPIDDSEADVIWKSAEGDNPEPSCTAEGIDNIIAAWNRKADIDTESDDELNRLLGFGTYNPIGSLPNGLNKLIEIESDRWSLPSLPYISILLSVVCSLLKVETVLNVRETKGKPILWVGIVGTSNSGKSECLRTITAPLTSLQRGANEDYEYALVDYERETVAYDKKKRGKDSDIGDKPRVPACREYYADDYTYEALGAICHAQKTRGLLLKLDELKAFCDFEKYGAANNRSRMLSLYDGHEIKCSRKGSQRMHIEKTAISLVGTTQYSTLSNIFANDDSSEDGLWARIVFVNLPTTATYSHEPETNNLLYTELARIYAAINHLDPMTFSPSNGAKKLWIKWYDSMVDRSIEKCGTFLESVYGKAKDRVARIALALHILHAAANSANPEDEVSEEVMRHAIGLGECLLLETEKAFALTDANPTTNPDEDRVVKFVTRFTDKGWVSARDVDRWWSARTKPPASELRRFMAKVVSFGYAIDNSEPNTSSKYRIQITRNGSDSSDKTPVNVSQSQESLSLTVVTDSTPQPLEHRQGNDSNFVTTIQIGSDKIEDSQNGRGELSKQSISLSLPEQNGSDKPETTLNSHHSQQSDNSVTNGSDKANGIHSNQSSDSVTTVTTIPSYLPNIGDSAKVGDRVVVITEVGNGYMVGLDNDGNPVRRHESLFEPVDDKPLTPNGYTVKDVGDGFMEIISNRSNSSNNTDRTIPAVTDIQEGTDDDLA